MKVVEEEDNFKPSGFACSDKDIILEEGSSLNDIESAECNNGQMTIPIYVKETLNSFNNNSTLASSYSSEISPSIYKNKGLEESITKSKSAADENPFIDSDQFSAKIPNNTSNKPFFKDQKLINDPNDVFVYKTIFKILNLNNPEELDEFNELYNTSSDKFSNKKIVSCSLKETSDGWKVLVKYNILKFLNPK